MTTVNGSNGSLAWVDPEPYASRVFRLTMFGVIIACAVIGNGTVCAVLLKQQGKYAPIRRMILHLAIAELVFSICHAFIFHQGEAPHGWLLGPAMCKLLMPLQVACNIATTFILAEIAVYRSIVLRRVLLPRDARSLRRYWQILLLITWAVAGVFAAPQGVFYRVEEWHGTLYCMDPEHQQRGRLYYQMTVFVVNYVIPLLVICTAYAFVCFKVRQHIGTTKRLIEHQKQQRWQSRADSTTRTQNIKLTETTARPSDPAINADELEPSDTPTGVAARRGLGGSDSTTLHSARHQGDEERGSVAGQATLTLENELLRTVTVIIGIYVVCYLPFQIHFLWIEFDWQTVLGWKYGFMVSRYLYNIICTPSAAHPFLYGLMSKSFRSELKC